MFTVAKIKKIDTLKISKFYFIFCVFKVFQCMGLGAALDNCLCFLLPEEYLTHRLNNYCCLSMTWY